MYAASDPSSLFGDALAPYSKRNRIALGGTASASCQAQLAAIALQSHSTGSSLPTGDINSATLTCDPLAFGPT
jgi:hypothetical protein